MQLVSLIYLIGVLIGSVWMFLLVIFKVVFVTNLVIIDSGLWVFSAPNSAVVKC